MTDQSMLAYCQDLEPPLIQLPAMMRRNSQTGRQAGQTHNTVINRARAKEMGHTQTEREEEEKRGRREKEGRKEKLQAQG